MAEVHHPYEGQGAELKATNPPAHGAIAKAFMRKWQYEFA